MACIYRHLKPDGEVFYIGISKGLSRPYDANYRSKFWKSIVEKHGYEVQILKNDLSWEDACELEIILIEFYGRRDLGTGTLVNMTDGGNGRKGKGKKLSIETIERMKLAQQNRKPVSVETRLKMSIKKRNISDETRLKMLNSKKGNTYKRNIKNSEETKQKIREKITGVYHEKIECDFCKKMLSIRHIKRHKEKCKELF